jgi:hypothetical protein
MVSYGTGTQQKTISWPLTIHPSWCAGGCWFAVAITLYHRRRLFQRNPKCGLSGPFRKLGGSFFCFAWFCKREVEPSWVQTCWTFSALPHPLTPPSPLLPSTLERWTEGGLWLCYISFFVGLWGPHSPFFHLCLLQQIFLCGPWRWPWCTPFFGCNKISCVGHEDGHGVLPSLARLLLQLVWLSFTLSPSHLYIYAEWSAEFSHWIVEIKK